MSSATDSDSSTLTPVTSGFVLAAAITVLWNTVLAWAKDLSPALSDSMKSLTTHHWTTHGLIDLALFVLLGILFTMTKAATRVSPGTLTIILIGSVLVSGLGLGAWYAFV